MLLHSYGRTPVQTTLVLKGTVRNYYKHGYGPRLVIQIPQIAGGSGALTRFAVAIRRKFRHHGKLRSFVDARCRDKKLKARGKFVFADGESLTDRYVQRCHPKQG